MEKSERIELFLELVHCSRPIDYWLYDEKGALLRSDSRSEKILDTVFRRTGCHDYLYALDEYTPVILSGDHDMHWIAVPELREGQLSLVHVLGPFFSADSTENVIRAIKHIEENWSEHWKNSLIDAVRALPVISLSSYSQYAVMLHYLVNGECLSVTDIQYQPEDRPSALEQFKSLPDKTLPKDRMQIYRAERSLLHAVREGDLDAARAARFTASSHVGRVRDYTGDPLQNTRIACTTFAAICTRAAIEGGLSATLSYSLGDAYIKNMFQARTIQEVGDVKDQMYAEFVKRVHDLHRNPEYSKAIQACCDHIMLHMTDPLSIELLANRLGYSKYYLSARFKKETGVTVSDYIKFVRIERAKLLLSTTNQSVEKIREAVGFPSRASFGRSFREVVGKTPSAYREETITI